jgi:catechol 2,3-dioxygenase-like lactoylglutathione lyase family enzyme
MTIKLNHTIVPVKHKQDAARQFAQLFGLSYEGLGEHFAPVKVNEGLTFLFDDDENFESHHYAFHVSDAEFDAILGRVKEAELMYGSAPWSADDKKLNNWGGGSGVYFMTSDGHLLELMTVPQ